MAVTAQTQAVLPLEPPTWATRPTIPRHRRRWSLAAAGLAGVGVLVATIVVATASGGAVSGDPTRGRGTVAASTDVSALGREYGSLLDRYENAERVWRTQANKMVAASTGSAAAAEALIPPTVHFADTVDQADHDLVHLPWPPSMRADVNALEAGLATVSGDLRSIGGQSVSSMPEWLSNVVDNASASSTASHRLIGDLGGTASR
ncbi:MAG TPA: hypothetical protein VGL32_04965 [Acidimicrobiales bacterium]